MRRIGHIHVYTTTKLRRQRLILTKIHIDTGANISGYEQVNYGITLIPKEFTLFTSIIMEYIATASMRRLRPLRFSTRMSTLE